jgi:hypothetical protein
MFSKLLRRFISTFAGKELKDFPILNVSASNMLRADLEYCMVVEAEVTLHAMKL